ncbi:MAG: ribonuclease HI family protein [Candidatus Aenigmarchaeota archaeon]|nr:ribonuclease HI family protein [Candidatus Aenigmarchaeota archaeon]
MILNIYTDGGSRNNSSEGNSAIGFLICTSENKILYEKGQYIGKGTNNQAEYSAMIQALKMAKQYKGENINCYSDSQLMIKQLLGDYRVKNPGLQKLFKEVKDIETAFKLVNYTHVRREHKMICLADELVNQALDNAVGKRKQR